MSNSSIRPIDSTLSSATTPGQSGLGSDCNEDVHCILQIFSITRASLSDSLVSYPGYSLRGLTLFQRCSWGILQPLLYWLGWKKYCALDTMVMVLWSKKGNPSSKSWTRLFSFHIALILLGKVLIFNLSISTSLEGKHWIQNRPRER